MPLSIVRRYAVTDHSSASNGLVCSHDSVRERVQGILRAAQANWTDEALSAACGVPARTIKSYRVEGKEPTLANALSLAVVIGPRALNPLLALIGYVARPMDEADELRIGEVVANGLQHFSTIATAAADGRIDHTEAPKCQEAADMLIATVLPLSSAGKAA